MRFKRIPRDVMDKRAVEQGDIQFFELAALGRRGERQGQDATLTLTDFVIPPDDVPEEVRRRSSTGRSGSTTGRWTGTTRGDTFHNQWQAFRTRKKPEAGADVRRTPTPSRASTAWWSR